MTQATIARPEKNEYFEYYDRYVARVPAGSVLETLENQLGETRRLLAPLSEEQALHRYAPDKWSIKQVIGHLCDTERVMSHRALRFARADRTPLPGFDENDYVKAADFDARSLSSLLDELGDVRRATLSMLRGLNEAALVRIGEANERDVSVRALAYIIAGHELHHVAILRERYGVSG